MAGQCCRHTTPQCATNALLEDKDRPPGKQPPDAALKFLTEIEHKLLTYYGAVSTVPAVPGPKMHS